MVDMIAVPNTDATIQTSHDGSQRSGSRPTPMMNRTSPVGRSSLSVACHPSQIAKNADIEMIRVTPAA